MSRGPCTFTETAVSRALKAAQRCGLVVYRFEIDRSGKIVVVTVKGKDSATDMPADDGRNEWDCV